MLFELDNHRSKVTAREMAPQSLEERQRDIYDSHRHRVFSISYYMTGSELEAEEILQRLLRSRLPGHAGAGSRY